MHSIRQKLLDLDMFGTPVSFNFRKKGNHYNSVIGGILSFFIWLLLIFCIFVNLKGMFTGDNANTFSTETATQLDEIGNITFKENGIKIMYALRTNGKYRLN